MFQCSLVKKPWFTFLAWSLKKETHISSNHSRWVTSGSYWEYNYSQVSWPNISQLGKDFWIQNSPFPWGQDCWGLVCTYCLLWSESLFTLKKEQGWDSRGKLISCFCPPKPENLFFRIYTWPFTCFPLVSEDLQEANKSLAQNWVVCWACLV